MRARSGAAVPRNDLELVNALQEFLRRFCAGDGRSEAAGDEFLQELRREALSARGAPGGGTAEEVARRVDELLDR